VDVRMARPVFFPVSRDRGLLPVLNEDGHPQDESQKSTFWQGNESGWEGQGAEEVVEAEVTALRDDCHGERYKKRPPLPQCLTVATLPHYKRTQIPVFRTQRLNSLVHL